MKSIDKLRVSEDAAEYQWISKKYMNKIAEEIEAEIAERYMLLPVDADGVRIELGDKLIEHEDGHEFIVDGMKIWGSTYEWWAYEDGGVQAPATRCTHVKPRTLEDVIEGAINAAFGNEAPFSVIAKKAADEIRELLLGGDA